MDHQTMPNVPPRIGSAPLAHSQQPFQRVINRNTAGIHRVCPPRPGGERPPSLHQSQPAFHSVGFFDRAAPQPTESAASSYPADCIYEIAEFLRCKDTKESPPKLIAELGRELWKAMPENEDNRSKHILSREELFKGEAVTSKVMRERKLRNEVLGILGRVGEKNLEKMKTELTNLPIRQSTNEEIQDVIEVIFNKSIQPEDRIFVPYYVKLVVHLINDIGEGETAGRFIRNAIIRECQRTFENSDEAQQQLEREMANLPAEEAEQRRLIFEGKQKANINFLGLLFTHGIIRERVVLHVLEWLLYGSERKRRIPADYELVHFMDLLLTCGKHFSRDGLEYVPRFRSVMEELMQTHPTRRIQFLLLNTLETIDNNWEPTFGSNAVPSSQDNDNERRSAHQLPARNKLVLAPPVNPIPTREEFWKAMDDFSDTSNAERVIALLADIPEETRIAYCASVIERYITTTRYTHQRNRLGELFEELANKRVLPIEDVRRALYIHLHDAVKHDIFTDVPKYFSNWAVVVKWGREVFPKSLHTEFLNILVDNGADRDTLINMVRDVHKIQDESGGAAETDARSRFRVLPALLRYTPPLLSGYAVDDAEDPFKQLRDCDSDVDYFYHLCEQEDSKGVFMCTNSLGKAPHLAISMVSAIFTYVRFDVEALCKEYKESVKKLVNIKQLHILLEEVYVTWLALDRTPENSFLLFVKALRSLNGTKDQLDKFKGNLTKSYGPTGKKDALMLDKLK